MADRVLRYTVVVRHPETLTATALVAGSAVPGWAGDLVSDDDLEDAPSKAAPKVEVAQEQPADAGPANTGRPDKSWTGPGIRKYADDNGIDLGEATTKADMLAVIDGDD